MVGEADPGAALRDDTPSSTDGRIAGLAVSWMFCARARVMGDSALGRGASERRMRSPGKVAARAWSWRRRAPMCSAPSTWAMERTGM